MQLDICFQLLFGGTIKYCFETVLFIYLLSFDLFRIGESKLAKSYVVHRNLCLDNSELPQCEAILNRNELPNNYNCNPDAKINPNRDRYNQDRCQMNDLIWNYIASCKLDVRPDEKDFYQRYYV